ncbi:Uncharacterised protein [Vibrio cholerae]|nr:Uncharacterised protein [Vibrio cholerae]
MGKRDKKKREASASLIYLYQCVNQSYSRQYGCASTPIVRLCSIACKMEFS